MSGATPREAVATGAVTLQIVRDEVVKPNERGPDGLVGDKISQEDRHRAASMKAVEDGPIPAVRGLVRCRVIPPCQ